MLLLSIAFIAGGAPLRAQYQSPLECQPPIGQQLYEMRVNNAAASYRAEPTATNRAQLCTAYAAAVRVFRNAVDGCRRSSCEEEAFRDICARREQMLAEIAERQRRDCPRPAR
jgi:hypothetical protein